LRAVKEWNVDYFKKFGSFQFMKVDDFEKAPKFVPVAYNGMGFFACRKGVIEKLKYPYFSYPLIEIEGKDGNVKICAPKMSPSVKISPMQELR
jgi:hypothetical protein